MERSFATRHRPPFRLRLLAPAYASTWALYAALAVLWITPSAVRAVLARVAAAVLVRVPSKRRAVTLANLVICFPDRSPSEIKTLLRRHARIQCEAYLAYGELAFAGAHRLLRRIDLKHMHHLAAATDGGSGALVMMPHCCGFEFGAQALQLQNPTVSMARVHRDNDAMDWLMTRTRSRFGGIVFDNRQSMLPLIKAVRQGYHFLYLPDEDRNSALSVFATFYGEPKQTTATIGRLAAACRSRVVPAICRYSPDSRRFELEFHAPLTGIPTGDPEADARRLNAAIEMMLEPDPAQYAWTQKIFRTRPEGHPAVYRKGAGTPTLAHTEPEKGVKGGSPVRGNSPLPLRRPAPPRAARRR